MSDDPLTKAAIFHGKFVRIVECPQDAVHFLKLGLMLAQNCECGGTPNENDAIVLNEVKAYNLKGRCDVDDMIANEEQEEVDRAYAEAGIDRMNPPNGYV